MKYLLFLGFLIYSNQGAALVIWPGTSAPCNTTLDACADGSPVGEVIEIRTNAVINETVSSSRATSFVAGVGYKPTFAGSSTLEITNQGSLETTITVSGLTFLFGHISYNSIGTIGSSNTTLNIKNNLMLGNNFAPESIRITNSGSHTLNLNIEFNQIKYNSAANLPRNGAITITNGSTTGTATSGIVAGRIYNNEINVTGDESIGIGLYEYASNTSDLNISSNTFTGGEKAAMYIEKDVQSLGDSQLIFANNAIYSSPTDKTLTGFEAQVYDGSLAINAINNSVVGAYEGFSFKQAFGGIFDINFYNNLVAFTRTSFIIGDPSATNSNPNLTFENNNNLFFENNFTDPDFVPGSGFVDDDPQIKSLSNARLRPGSPAIEAGNPGSLLFTLGVANIDADGLYRIKNGNPGSGGTAIDIGAYEAGDRRVLDTLKGNTSNLNPIEDATINFDAFAKVQITQNLNPNGTSLIEGIDNDINMGVYKNGSTWTLFSQDFSPVDTNTAFNVWNPAPSNRNFVHTAEDAISASESFTELDRSGLNNNPDAIVAVTQLWEGIYNDNPVGVFYNPFTGRWNIYNSNLVDMPWMSKFNVYFQAESANAFLHHSSDANITADASYIDHPLLNDSPCAQFQITYDSGIVFDEKVGVFYSQTVGKWGVFTQSHNPMPEGAKFHVIISAEQIEACNGDLIFADDFE